MKYKKIIKYSILVISSPLFLYIIQLIVEQKSYFNQPKDRLNKLIEQNWKGDFTQPDPRNKQDTLSSTIRIEFSHFGRKIKGTLISRNPFDNKDETFKLYNGYFNGQVLKIEYKNADEGIFQMGSIVLLLDNYGKKLEGRFVGFSPIQKTIISESLTLDPI